MSLPGGRAWRGRHGDRPLDRYPRRGHRASVRPMPRKPDSSWSAIPTPFAAPMSPSSAPNDWSASRTGRSTSRSPPTWPSRYARRTIAMTRSRRRSRCGWRPAALLGLGRRSREAGPSSVYRPGAEARHVSGEDQEIDGGDRDPRLPLPRGRLLRMNRRTWNFDVQARPTPAALRIQPSRPRPRRSCRSRTSPIGRSTSLIPDGAPGGRRRRRCPSWASWTSSGTTRTCRRSTCRSTRISIRSARAR